MTGLNLVVVLLVAAVLLTIALYKKGLLLKLVAVTYVFAVASVVYFSFDTYKGWPTKDDPVKGKVISIHIIDPRGKTPGAIYFWVSGTKETSTFEKIYTYVPDDMTSPPRAHFSPYTKNKADAFREAQRALEKGMTVTIDSIGKDGKATEAEATDGDQKKGDKDGNRGDSDEYDVPHFKIEDPSKGLEKQQ